MKKKIDVYGLGNPLIDILVTVSDEIIHELGLVKDSMNLVSLEKQKEILDTIEKAEHLEPLKAVGGSCANTVAMIAQLGGKTAYSGKAGADDLGDEYENQLIQQGVISVMRRSKVMTGSTVILVSKNAERTMNTYLGASQHLEEADVDLDILENCGMLYVEGYLWDTPSQKETVVYALENAKKKGIKTALSLSDPFCVERHKEDFQRLVDHYVDLVFCNAEEAAHLVGDMPVEETTAALFQKAKHFVYTQGADGAIIGKDGKQYSIPAIPISAVDTTGAGDSYAAGYLYGIAQGYTVEQAGTLAAACASLIVGQMGPRFEGNLRETVQAHIL